MSLKLKFTLILITFFIGLSSATFASAATQIYRSVGPSATGVLENDNSHARAVTVSSGTATFSSALADNIGVGDAVLIDTGGTDQTIDASDTLLFISSRTSSTVYTLKTHTGATPSNISSNDTYSIYRAYTSLANAESGTKNTSIPITFNGGDRDLVANDEVWNIACYANGTTADTGVINIDGWTTDATRYLRIYTPVTSDEVGTSQRHSGKWDDEKYKLEPTASDYHFYIAEEYVRVDGLQGTLSSSSQDARVFFGVNPSGTGEVTLSNMIIRGIITGSPSYCNAMYFMGANVVKKVFNNIIYDIKGAGSNGAIYSTAGTTYAYNNTVYGTDRGFVQTGGTFVVKNNIINGTSGDAFINSFTSTSNNISDDTTSPDSAYRNIIVSFLNSSNKDFHLSQSDTAAKNSGTDLTSDANLPFSTDIDGATRTSVTAWDIGADETAIQIFRSVGASATDSLATDNSHSRTIVVSSGVATFSAELDNKIGVGDAVLVDTNSDNSITSADTVLFIQGRTSSTVYTLKTHTGATPSDITSNDTYQIYRAYTSAFQATDGGTRNSSIPVSFNSMISRDLMANNEQWNISCYAGQSYSSDLPVDTSWMNIGNISKTGVYNFIKVYTPFSSNEVGFSQRHTGKWTESAYKQGITATYSWSIYVDVENVIIEGLQIKVPTQNGDYLMGIALNKRNNYAIDNIIIDGNPSGGTSHWGIYLAYTAHGNLYAKNNIILNLTGTSSSGIRADYALDNKYYIYNNTIFNAYNGVMADPNVANAFAKNNIVQNSSNYSYYGIVETAAGGNNITNNSIDPVAFGIAADSGTTSSTTAAKLVDSTQNFLTTVKVGNIIKNTTDNTFTYVTAIDSNTQLSVNNDIFTTGESYTISTNKYGNVSFVSTVSGAEDFHLSQSDTTAREAGVNLTTEAPPGAGFLFSTDIDGQLRNSSGTGWDIGADEGMVEFTPTVMQTGGDYSSLGSWESGVQTNLTATTTRVFSHSGITGTIADNATITGQTSGATATVVHATTTQILLESISGTFQSGETVQVTAGNSVVISNNGNPASAVAKIDGAWSSADNNIVLDGWITGYQNYIKIYTTTAARHSGKWDETKYRIVSSWGGIFSYEDNTIVNGIQSYLDGGGYIAGVMLLNDGDKNIYNINFSDNIFKSTGSGSDRDGISVKCYEYMRDINIYNNIVYNIPTGITLDIATAFNINVYNNTIYNISVRGIYITREGGLLRNNIVQGSGVNYYKDNGSNATGTSNNISSDGTAPGTNSKTNTTVSFISTVSGAEDFHLAQSDTAAKNSGVDLSTDSYLPFSTDIDDNTRNASITAWDIGADEAATQIYRSVGPSDTSSLANDSSHANTVSVSGGVATFSTALPDKIGVGDALLIDTGGTDQSIDSSDTLLFISGRTSSTVYTVKTHTGATPNNISSNDTYQIYRAYTSLSNAESGTKNTSIPITFNGGDRDIFTNNEQWNIACYANGATDDNIAVTVDGWNTAPQNFVNIYTPVNSTEVGTSQRHKGKWSGAAGYRIRGSEYYGVLRIEDLDVSVDGLQIENTKADADEGALSGIFLKVDQGRNHTFSNNIIRQVNKPLHYEQAFNDAIMVSLRGIPNEANVKVYNNIIYGYSHGVRLQTGGTTKKEIAILNNTFANCRTALITVTYGSYDYIYVKNNIAQTSSTSYDLENTFHYVSDYSNNISSDSTAPGTNSKTNIIVSFVSTASGFENFHLAQSDTAAKNSGVDLSSLFSVDVDSLNRNASINAWDIGADEAATQIYRSVGPSATASLATDSSHSSTVTVTSGVATFSAALSNSIGVGDVLLIDTGGTDQSIDSSDTLLFISGRTSSTVYTVKTHTGATPSNISSNDTYSIYRAYTSLANAESGTKNTSIPIAFNGGDRDIVTNNEEWNIACYANGTTADGGAFFSGWSTLALNTIKVYTPVSSSEVGTSQRHNGKWDNQKFYVQTTNATGITGYNINNLEIDGLQINIVVSSSYYYGVRLNDGINSKSVVSNSIVKGTFSGTGSGSGIYRNWSSSSTTDIYNNIVYNFRNVANTGGIGIDISGYSAISVYNNTVYNSYTGITDIGTAAIYKNNITQNCTNGFSGSLNASSDYNISDLVSDAPSPSYRSGLATTVSFISTTSGVEDFHLSQTDTSARGAGANLTTDSYLPITRDIDNQLRNPSGTGWDIGADEGTVEFTPTVMQSGGDYSTLSSWESGVQTDLTADTTRVFSHGGITGTIADNATVTGLTSSATATVVHATTTQILLENISGTFQSGETVQVTSGNNVVISGNGNPASAVAKIDGSWSSADGRADISGWTTGADNYIKVYTTSTSRHPGKWDDTKYRISYNGWEPNIGTHEEYIQIDGVQFYSYTSGAFYPRMISSGVNNKNSLIKLSNNLFKANWSGLVAAGSYQGIAIQDTTNYGAYGNMQVYNNIFYNLKSAPGWSAAIYSGGFNFYVYNNTVYNGDNGFIKDGGSMMLKNNLVANTTNPFNGGYATGTDYNATDINDTPGTGSNNKINQTFNFVSTISGSEDLHIKDTSDNAIDKGADLSTDANFAFNTDIDGNTRTGSWDIGADETATQLYRSVAPGATGLLDSDSTHTKTVTLSNGIATFSTALPDNIGVGDVVIIDGDSSDTITSADTLLFIHKRNDSTHYVLRTHTGATPSDIAVNDTYNIYRAYTSLFNAEAGAINSTLSGLGFSFNGGNRDLVTNNEIWNIACYANGTTADTTAVTVNGWNTSQQNFIKIYTPVSISEVGTSQRHNGKWDDNKYHLSVTTAGIAVLNVYSFGIKIDGLQIEGIASGIYQPDGIYFNDVSDYISISNNIIKNGSSNVEWSSNRGGIEIGHNTGKYAYVWNNIIYNFISSNNYGTGIIGGWGYAYCYNNTVYSSHTGFESNGNAIAKNNISQNCTDGYVGTFNASSDYNISDLSSDAPSASYRSGLATDVSFIDEANKDFRLAYNDTAAKGAGVNLSNDSYLSFTNDIRGQSRPKSSNAWSIGACEALDVSKLKLEGTQVKMEGDMKVE